MMFFTILLFFSALSSTIISSNQNYKNSITHKETYNIIAGHYAMLLSTIVNIHMCIQDNKPIALFGNFVNPSNGKKINHAVTCYGTQDIPLGQGKTNRYFIVNFGWTGYSKVYLLDNIFRNPVGSMYNMNY